MPFAREEPRYTERRRYPRLGPAADIKMWLPVVVNAELLDLSAGGALLSTSASLQPGQRAQLRLILDHEPFSAWIEIKRVEAGTQDGQPRIRAAAAFTSIDGHSEVTLRHFLRDDPRP
jgi:hypothetical protein